MLYILTDIKNCYLDDDESKPLLGASPP